MAATLTPKMEDISQVLTEHEVKDAPLTFADLGIVTTPVTADSPFGKIRSIHDVSVEEWFFMSVTLVGILVTLGFSINYISFGYAPTDNNYVVAWLMLVNSLFTCYYLWPGLRQERMYELLMLALAFILATVYSIVSYIIDPDRSTIRLAHMIASLLIGPCVTALALHIGIAYGRSGRLLFTTIGCKTEIINMVKILFLSYSLLKFELQLTLSTVILGIYNNMLEDLCVLCFGTVFAVVRALLAYFAGRRECRWMLIVYFCMTPFLFAHMAYALVTVNLHTPKLLLKVCLYICTILAMLVHITLLVVMAFVYRNFGKGLKERIYLGQSDIAIAEKVKYTSAEVTSEVPA